MRKCVRGCFVLALLSLVFNKHHYIELISKPMNVSTNYYVMYHWPVWYVQASIHSSLHGTKHPCASRCSCKADIKVATEGSRLAVNRLHLIHLTIYLLTATVYAIQVQLLQQLLTTSQQVQGFWWPQLKLGNTHCCLFPVAASMFWNTLPDDIQSAPSVSAFRRLLKTFLFQHSFPDVIL